MASSTTRASTHLSAEERSASSPAHGSRRIGPQAGRALEILAHAIEYLSDEYIFRAHTFSASDPDVQAIQILMALNRQVYFECPRIPTFVERCKVFFRPRSV